MYIEIEIQIQIKTNANHIQNVDYNYIYHSLSYNILSSLHKRGGNKRTYGKSGGGKWEMAGIKRGRKEKSPHIRTTMWDKQT
jgi:hypothetical protein